MLLLKGDTGMQGRRMAFAVFGVGMIGSAIVETLLEAEPLTAEFHPVDWADSGTQRQQLRSLEEEISAFVDPAVSGGEYGVAPRLGIVWSAGKAGFGASKEQVSNELQSFQAVLEAADRLTCRFPETAVLFCLISSAGGLFEGQRFVGIDSQPTPRRAYGGLKLQQEGLLMSGTTSMTRKVYRLTSVYGYTSRIHRQGLIPTLIGNGILQKVSHITGRMDTLRDFIWLEDVARYITRDLVAGGLGKRGRSISILASTKPSSLYEIQNLVEEVLGKRIYVSFSTEASNSADITFSPSVRSPGWVATDLLTGIRKIYKNAVGAHRTSSRSVAVGGRGGFQQVR